MLKKVVLMRELPLVKATRDLELANDLEVIEK